MFFFLLHLSIKGTFVSWFHGEKHNEYMCWICRNCFHVMSSALIRDIYDSPSCFCEPTILSPAPYLSRDTQYINMSTHDVITWKRFLYYWPFVREINKSLVDSFGKSLWYGALMFPLLLGWIKCWTNSRVAFLFQMTLYSCGVTVMTITCSAMDPGGHLNIKMLSYQNRDFHYKDSLTTVLSLWWNSPHLERTALY